MTLRPYQVDALAEVRAAFAAGKRRVLLVMPTGAGKTTMFAEMAEAFDGSVLILAHRRELIRQAVKRVRGATPYPTAFGGRIGVGSIQTLGRRVDKLPPFGLIIPDEAHHAVSGQYAALLGSQPDALVLGVTATPERLDGRGLGAMFDHMVVGPSIAELVAGGYLSRVEVFAPAAPPDVRELHTVAGDFSPRELSTLMDKPKIVGDAVDHYGWHAPGQAAIVFCVSVQAAEHAAEAFCHKGWRAVAVNGETPVEQRDAAFAGLADGSIELVCSCSLIDEGLDIPNVSCVIDLAPSKSLTKVMQRVGRGMRPAPGKECLTLLDHAGNTLTHGMPDSPRDWSLAGREKRVSGAPPVRQCPTCFAIHAPRATCPACGYDYAEGQAAAERRRIEQVEGELAKLSPEDRRLVHLRTTPLKELLRGATYEMIDEIRRARGYHPAWTDRQASFRRSVSTLHTHNGEELGPI